MAEQHENKQIESKKEKLWTWPFILLVLCGTATSSGFFMVTPTIAKYAVSFGRQPDFGWRHCRSIFDHGAIRKTD